jgi:hypothetical protein
MDLQARADHLAQMIEERLDVRGQGLEAKLRRAGRLLPRHVRSDAALVLRAMEQAGHPKLARQIDEKTLKRACRRVEAYLGNIDPWARRWSIVLGWLAGNAFSLLVIAGLLITVLAWRGFL